MHGEADIIRAEMRELSTKQLNAEGAIRKAQGRLLAVQKRRDELGKRLRELNATPRP